MIEYRDEIIAKFEYDFNKISKSEAVLNFCYYYGRSSRILQIAGVNNEKLYNNMFKMFSGNEIFYKFFAPLDEKLNCTPVGLKGFEECEAVREKLLNSDIEIYYLTTVLEFGKYKDKTIEQVFNENPKYLKYLESTGKVFSNSVKKMMTYI